MRRGAFLLLAVVVVVVGAMALKGFAGERRLDRRPSVDNADPEGLLAFTLWLRQRGHDVQVRERHDAPFGAGLLIVPPPAAARWTVAERDEILDALSEGRLDVLAFCGATRAENQALSPLVGAVGLGCDPGGQVQQNADALLSGLPGPLVFPSTQGTVRVEEGRPGVALYGSVEQPAAVLAPRERGFVMLLGNASPLANDGLGRGANAAMVLAVAAGRPIIIDEAHHRPRRAEVVGRALQRAGPRTGLLALLLLLPLALLGQLPRRGDAPRGGGTPGPPAAEAQARALASLYPVVDTPRESLPVGSEHQAESRDRVRAA